MALEADLLAGRDTAGLGLHIADCFFHRTCSPRVAWTRDGGYGSRSPAACVELDRLADPPPVHLAVRPRAHQLSSQPDSFRRYHGSDLLRHFDIAEGDSDIDRHESRARHGLALGLASQSVLASRGHVVRASPGDQLGLGARGRSEAFSPRSGRRAVKLLRVLSRIALLSVVAAAFVGSTRIYGGSLRAPLLSP